MPRLVELLERLGEPPGRPRRGHLAAVTSGMRQCRLQSRRRRRQQQQMNLSSMYAVRRRHVQLVRRQTTVCLLSHSRESMGESDARTRLTDREVGRGPKAGNAGKIQRRLD